jgi:serine/threonine protein kinase
MSILGKGADATVIKFEKEGVCYACKHCNIESENLSASFVREVLALKSLTHRNIISLVEVLLDSQSLLLPLAQCDLCHLVLNENYEPVSLANDIVQGLVYLQKQNVYHSDLKPKNILIFAKGNKQYA